MQRMTGLQVPVWKREHTSVNKMAIGSPHVIDARNEAGGVAHAADHHTAHGTATFVHDNR